MLSLYLSNPVFVKASPVFSKGKSDCRLQFFLESGFSTGPSPGFVVCHLVATVIRLLFLNCF